MRPLGYPTMRRHRESLSLGEICEKHSSTMLSTDLFYKLTTRVIKDINKKPADPYDSYGCSVQDLCAMFIIPLNIYMRAQKMLTVV